MQSTTSLKKKVKQKTRWIVVTLPVVALATVAMFSVSRHHKVADNTRYPASNSDHSSLKKRVLGSVGHDHGMTHTHKLTPPISVKIEPVGEADVKAGEALVLQAKVLTEKDFDRLNIKWSIPHEVVVISGELATVIDDIKAGETETVEIMIEQTEQNQQIHVHAAVENQTVQYGNVAQYNTVWQKEIDEAKEALKNRAAKHIRKHLKGVYK